ncbi:MAG: hypothetical protein RL385_1289, partial [Pseudomonadota bacterium]
TLSISMAVHRPRLCWSVLGARCASATGRRFRTVLAFASQSERSAGVGPVVAQRADGGRAAAWRVSHAFCRPLAERRQPARIAARAVQSMVAARRRTMGVVGFEVRTYPVHQSRNVRRLVPGHLHQRRDLSRRLRVLCPRPQWRYGRRRLRGAQPLIASLVSPRRRAPGAPGCVASPRPCPCSRPCLSCESRCARSARACLPVSV